MEYKEPKLYFCENNKQGDQVIGVICKYTPPTPKITAKGNKVLLGYTHFQTDIKSDVIIKFSIAFDINNKTDIANFLRFRNNYNKIFYFVDEFDIRYRGVFTGEYNTDMPIEGEIYYMQIEMTCPHDISGYKGE